MRKFQPLKHARYVNRGNNNQVLKIKIRMLLNCGEDSSVNTNRYYSRQRPKPHCVIYMALAKKIKGLDFPPNERFLHKKRERIVPGFLSFTHPGIPMKTGKTWDGQNGEGCGLRSFQPLHTRNEPRLLVHFSRRYLLTWLNKF